MMLNISHNFKTLQVKKIKKMYTQTLLGVDYILTKFCMLHVDVLNTI